MPKSSLNVSLKGADDIFSTEESRQEEKREQVQQIPIAELFPFKNHPFKVLDDETMQRTVESIQQIGVTNPLIARPRPEGGYEIISGHRRQHAAQLAGLDTLPVIVRQMDDDAAILLMVDSNLQRESILPSERAFAYKMKLEAMKRTSGRPSKENVSQIGTQKRSDQIMAEELGESRNQIQRFIRLTNLIPELLDMVDADDFIIGVKGSKEDCQWIKSKLSEFIGQTLKMELSEEKTLITHSSECARFLGFDVRVRRCEKVKRNKKGTKARTLNNHVELLVPFDDKIHNFIFSKGIAIQKKDGKLFPVHRNSLLRLTDLEIVTVYNDELRGICNYYGIASNFCKLKYLSYLTEYSCLKTLAAKHKSKISKVVAMYKDGTGEWGIPYETKKKAKRRYFANYMDCKDAKISTDCISNAAIIYGQSVTPLEKRLKARICELCGTTESERYEIHHINKLKNLKGKEPWEIAMLAKRRKTLVVCEHCHHLIHNQ